MFLYAFFKKLIFKKKTKKKQKNSSNIVLILIIINLKSITKILFLFQHIFRLFGTNIKIEPKTDFLNFSEI